MHLLTLKKFQVSFGNEEFLYQVLGDDNVESADQLSEIFKGIQSLEDGGADNTEVIQKAIDSPHKYVIKPQKEGGGHNFYGE